MKYHIRLILIVSLFVVIPQFSHAVLLDFGSTKSDWLAYMNSLSTQTGDTTTVDASTSFTTQSQDFTNTGSDLLGISPEELIVEVEQVTEEIVHTIDEFYLETDKSQTSDPAITTVKLEPSNTTETTVRAVPEPTTVALMLLGLLGLAFTFTGYGARKSLDA